MEEVKVILNQIKPNLDNEKNEFCNKRTGCIYGLYS